MLEWFLLIISKQYTVIRSRNLLIRNHSTLCSWLRREGKSQVFITNFMIRSTEAAVRKCSSKQFFLKFRYIPRKQLSWRFFLIKLQTSRPGNTSAGVSLDYCEVFKNAYFENYLQTVALSWNIILILLWKT